MKKVTLPRLARWIRHCQWRGAGIIAIVVLMALTGIALYFHVARGYTWATWTGFTPSTTLPNYSPGKTLWDWLDLLIVPAVLAVGGVLFTSAQRRREESLAEKRADADYERAQDQQREDALQAYFDKMTDLLLGQQLLGPNGTTEARAVARLRTLTTLRMLDADRKGLLLRFLCESGLICDPTNPVVTLQGADLKEAHLYNAHLAGANLSKSDLGKANVSRANLGGVALQRAFCVGTNFQRAQLRKADLTGAILVGAWINQADLGGADLSEVIGTTVAMAGALFEDTLLRNALLTWADMSQAILIGADLSGADLKGANLSDAWLIGSDLSSADLTDAKLSRIKYSKDTKWPPQYHPPAGAISLEASGIVVAEEIKRLLTAHKTHNR